MSKSDTDGNECDDVECPTCENAFSTKRGMKIHHKRTHGESLTKTTVECSECGSDVVKHKTQVEKFDNHYCDHECRGDALEGVTGEEAPAYGNNHPTGEDHGSWERIEVECSNCGSIIKKQPAKVERSEEHFCDIDCHAEWRSENIRGEDHPLSGLPAEESPNWDGGHDPYYGANWKKQRRKAKNRDGNECVICGKESDLEVHHIIPFKKFGVENYSEANKLDNLVTLCITHHREWEGVPLKPQ